MGDSNMSCLAARTEKQCVLSFVAAKEGGERGTYSESIGYILRLGKRREEKREGCEHYTSKTTGWTCGVDLRGGDGVRGTFGYQRLGKTGLTLRWWLYRKQKRGQKNGRF